MITRQRGPTGEVSHIGDAVPDSSQSHGRSNEQVIDDLETEIRSLQQRLQQFRPTQKKLRSRGSSVPTMDHVTEEIQELEQLVKENEILSGLTISEASFSVLEQDMTSSLRQHAILGEAGGMQFKLQYDVREQLQKKRDSQPHAEVLMLEMDVRDDMVALLKSDLFSIAADVNIRELFQLLASYGSWVEDRERAINHFASTFPEMVQREDVNDEGCNINMVISDPKQDLKLRVLWGLKVLPMKMVVPDLQLQVEASPEVLARDEKGTLDSASDIFQLMLKKFGIESALHMLIKLMDEAPS